ncbi:Thiol peroxidase, Tpx-type [Photobacterium marinum]|uniref:Thiol peroxidase, Tpx-type n=1 Tax=Photobacterium marinum TaxID=1056511 RepID=L8JG76_9GAMM|nr:redoxin family protein [Photobacterium marinum]ELR66437.1 Thiol peroxidase, Tpx-type [Photobacterium marinum]
MSIASHKVDGLACKFPNAGTQAPCFILADNSNTDISLSDLEGKNILLNIIPSIHIAEWAQSLRDLNLLAGRNKHIHCLCLSADLPFAIEQFCQKEGLDYIHTASFFRDPVFTENYGLQINTGALKGMSAPAVICLNTEGTIIYSRKFPHDNLLHDDKLNGFREAIKALSLQPNVQAEFTV